MSNIIPPLLSNTPPPPPSPEDEEDDEFGDFTGANDLSYGCDNLSLPPSPDHTPKKITLPNGLDINSNSEKNKVEQANLVIKKDFQDKRKGTESCNNACSLEDICIEELEFTNNVHIQNNIPECPSNSNSINYCHKHLVDETIIMNGEDELYSNQNTDDKTDEKKTVELIWTEVESNPQLLCSVDTATLSNSSNLHPNVDDSKITLETHANESNIEIHNFQDLSKREEIKEIYGDKKVPSFEYTEETNSKTSQEMFENPLKIESKDNYINDNVYKISSKVDIGFADFTSADVGNECKLESMVCMTNECDTFCATAENVNTDSPLRKLSGVLERVEDSEMRANDLDEDDFDEFCDFTSNTAVEELIQEESLSSSSQNSDDFGNFANFSKTTEEPNFLLNERQAMEKSSSIVREMFPMSSNLEEDFQYADVEKDDFIFNELKDITETNALTFLWSKSASQSVLLRALNIDARNILYGTSWNPSMPRFAANLGLAPLEPVRTEMAPSTLKSSPSTSSQPSNCDIPNAQFDWNGSGLVNPLDSISKDSKEMLQTNKPEKSRELSTEISILQPHVVPKSTVPQKEPSKNDLEEEFVSSDKMDDDDFDDFTSYQCSAPSDTWPNVVHLRETYISNEVKELPLDISNWLQPTIVTPELPRKELEIVDDDLPNIQTPEYIRKEVSFEDNDDEFDDFQMVLPEKAPEKNDVEVNRSVTCGTLQTTPSVFKLPVVSNNLDSHNLEYTNISFPEESPNVNVNISNQDQNKLEIGVAVNDDDEFTEFHSSAPVHQLDEPKPLTPILEPLKPVPVYTTPSSTETSSTTSINWPDPGVTDDEIKKIELVFKRPQGYSNQEEPKKIIKEVKSISKSSSFDDDEWSDFVSVQKPSPVHKFHSSEKERTSSPDLTLSVLNLGNIQPSKPPIPVITPQGLIQTKLSSNNSLNVSPKMQAKSNTMNTHPKPVYQTQQIHPSIISNQFASQLYNFNCGSVQQNKAALNLPSNQAQNMIPQSTDEDDWSDFISSPLPPSTANGYQQSWQNSPTYNQSNWSNSSPNIIANPSHFLQSGSDRRNVKVPSLSVNSKKSSIPNISLPELDFIAPKGRTSSSRKK